MFREIKRQITLFNTLILIAFLFLFIFLLGFLVQWSLGLTGEVFLMDTAKGIINNTTEAEKNDTPFKNNSIHDKVGYDYIEWDKNNQAINIKVQDKDLIMRGQEFVLDKNIKNEFRTFNLNSTDYRVYLTHFMKNGEEYTLEVFQEITAERSMITYVISFLLFIGSGGILLLIPISYFLAGKSLQPIKETFENQKKFIADASHELRTPLTVIQTNVEVLKLKEDQVLKENIKWLNNISIESETMARLVSELLLIAQADNKKVIMKKEVFNLSALCAEIIDLMFDVAKENDILLKGKITENVDYKGDEERLKQAIRILVDNAIKYTPGVGNVIISLTDSKRNVCISVKDSGVGLTEDEKKKIFSRFYRVDDARHREKGGVGLGLNIADMIIKQHNGKIKIESIPNEGSTFMIILPKTILK